MNKITKKQLHNGWHCHDTEIIKMKRELRELKQSVLRLEKLTDEKLLDEPQLKQLDQSVFNNMHERWKFAAVDKNGSAHRFNKEVFPYRGGFCYEGEDCNELKFSLIGKGYDASNWQNSLIERDIAKEPAEVDLSSELTGSELCKAMLARGDKYVMCFVHEFGDDRAIEDKASVAINFFNEYGFQTDSNQYNNAVPINNKGEPLTASEVGL